MSTLEGVNVGAIDQGRLARSIDDHLSGIAKDVARRPNKSKARKVVVTIEIKPEVTDMPDGTRHTEAQIDWKVDFSVPGQKGSVTKGLVKDDMVMIDPWAGENPKQTTIPEVTNPQASEQTEEQPPNVEPFTGSAAREGQN